MSTVGFQRPGIRWRRPGRRWPVRSLVSPAPRAEARWTDPLLMRVGVFCERAHRSSRHFWGEMGEMSAARAARDAFRCNLQYCRPHNCNSQGNDPVRELPRPLPDLTRGILFAQLARAQDDWLEQDCVPARIKCREGRFRN